MEIIARKALLDVGLQYRHGTGHGIGAYLGVHEGQLYNIRANRGSVVMVVVLLMSTSRTPMLSLVRSRSASLCINITLFLRIGVD